ncbi:type II toxin-antitoxin system VapB family antitoxin [Magnetospira sp. QH-2]|uniref:type II toxin-antitoxin system VapB family antitoxin n=1 Tax=Magnetospira sp. (strain QH-2) TaxID=1288970 RepID=UPI0003E814D8|nr:type II toxin-antitoxin system VapB family antitoxin [Magnetospira sp. QH-2]CCQ74385.1 Conserved protein of unknown function [Magnetospira sp. QH-2]
MALNIKNAETEALVTELARLTGRSKTATVTEALRKYKAELDPSPTVGRDRYDRLLNIAHHAQSLAEEGIADPDSLYDEDGLFQ